MTSNYLWQSTLCKTEIKKEQNELKLIHAKNQVVVLKKEVTSVKLIKSKIKIYNRLAIFFPVLAFLLAFIFFELRSLHYYAFAVLTLPFFAFAYYFNYNKYNLILTTNKEHKIRIVATSRKRSTIKNLFYTLADWKPKNAN